MEPFLDGGLFELLFALAFAVFVNFIFLKRYLLILFSLIIITAPVLLFFMPGNEFRNWIIAVCLFNSVLSVVLIWKQKKEKPAGPLFNVEIMKRELSEFMTRISNLFSKRHSPGKSKIKV